MSSPGGGSGRTRRACATVDYAVQALPVSMAKDKMTSRLQPFWHANRDSALSRAVPHAPAPALTHLISGEVWSAWAWQAVLYARDGRRRRPRGE